MEVPSLELEHVRGGEGLVETKMIKSLLDESEVFVGC